jgi:hypothetical protein
MSCEGKRELHGFHMMSPTIARHYMNGVNEETVRSRSGEVKVAFQCTNYDSSLTITRYHLHPKLLVVYQAISASRREYARNHASHASKCQNPHTHVQALDLQEDHSHARRNSADDVEAKAESAVGEVRSRQTGSSAGRA